MVLEEERIKMTSYEFEVAAKNAVIQCIKEHHPRVFAMVKDFVNSVVEDRADELSRAKRAKDGNNCCG